MGTKRLGYIDIAKALAITLIIVGHVGLVFNRDVVPGGMPYALTRFAFTVHLPVFFMLSGYFLHADQPLSRALVKKNAKNLLLPYAAACVLIIVLTTLAARLVYHTSMVQTAWRWLCASLWGAGATHPFALVQTERIGGIWFLLALFWAHLLIAATARVKDPVRTLIMVAALVLSVVAGTYVWLPFSLLSGLGCAFYVYLGALIRKYQLFERVRGPWRVIPALFWGIAIIWGGRASLAMSQYPLGVFDVLGGVGGCFCVVWASKGLERLWQPLSLFLQWIGRNTLAIFSIHIVEDNVIPWGLWGTLLSQTTNGMWYDWIILLLSRFLVDALLVAALYKLPVINRVFFPSLRDAQTTAPKHMRHTA